MPEPIIVELEGHKATVKWIKGQLNRWPFEDPGPDCLSVWVDFDEAVDGTQGFGFVISAVDYSAEALRAAIKEAGECAVKVMLEKNRKDREYRKDELRREKALNTLGESLFSKLAGEN